MTYNITIEIWQPDHPRWQELLDLMEKQHQKDWAEFSAAWHLDSYFIVALLNDEVVGFLRFVTQPIGPEMDCPPVRLAGKVLLEAKVLAFGVMPEHRRKGIGKRLQEFLIEQARLLGCHQVRSHSSGNAIENQQLKLRLGFGVHPIVRGEDRGGAYFILPL